MAALTANALRPPRGQRIGIPAFFAGWQFGETAPQKLALTAADTPGHAGSGSGRRIASK